MYSLSPFTVLQSFGGKRGSEPNGLVLAKSGILYGTTYHGGSVDAGTVFQLSPPASSEPARGPKRCSRTSAPRGSRETFRRGWS